VKQVMLSVMSVMEMVILYVLSVMEMEDKWGMVNGKLVSHVMEMEKYHVLIAMVLDPYLAVNVEDQVEMIVFNVMDLVK
jgi:hypothetical protein